MHCPTLPSPKSYSCASPGADGQDPRVGVPLYTATHCLTLPYTAPHCNALHCPKLPHTALHLHALPFTALHYPTLPYRTRHCLLCHLFPSTTYSPNSTYPALQLLPPARIESFLEELTFLPSTRWLHCTKLHSCITNILELMALQDSEVEEWWLTGAVNKSAVL